MKHGDKIEQGTIACVIVNEECEPTGVYIYGSSELIPIEEIKICENDGQLELIL